MVLTLLKISVPDEFFDAIEEPLWVPEEPLNRFLQIGCMSEKPFLTFKEPTHKVMALYKES